MGQRYIMETEAFYRLGHYYKPGEPFEIAKGTTPPRRAIKYEEYHGTAVVAPDPRPALSEMGKVEKASNRKD